MLLNRQATAEGNAASNMNASAEEFMPQVLPEQTWGEDPWTCSEGFVLRTVVLPRLSYQKPSRNQSLSVSSYAMLSSSGFETMSYTE